MTTTKRRKKQKSGAVVAVLLSLFCLALLGIGVWLFLQESGMLGRTQDGVAKAFQVEGLDPAAKTGPLPGVSGRERLSGENLFGYRIETAPSFSAGGKGKINVENPSFNRYLLVLEIARADDPTVLYRSQYIAPNQYIETVSLDSPPAGKYDAIAYLNLIDPKTMRVADILEQPLTLTVKEK